ncbi:hypothetical protein GCM10010992_23600 [Cloacibacterium rupense]|uniref:Tubby C 2 n=1 Tax=Cloacibacterium rupense TaxID=517423 RepID=A0ABQ2NM76_9FLAO|nr:hypothetical protein [Cloacibacterium rupense]GGP05863.1 hypothetical protein GCM10010992_23600 [Cloacibacterium rupense]
MKTLIAKSINSRNFELFDENEVLLGNIVYPKWYSTNAEIHTDAQTYKIKAKGFWTTSIEVVKQENVLMKFKMSWSGNIVVTDFNNGERHFQINKEKWYNDIFEMKDETEKTILKIKRNFKWKDFKYYYEIVLEDDALLPITILGILHVVNYFNASSDTAAYA